MATNQKSILESLQWVMTTYNSFHSLFDQAPQSLKDKLPMFLNLSYEDERRWADLWPSLDGSEQKNITDFLESLQKHERNSFRYVVIGMPKHEVKKNILSSAKGEKATTTTEMESRAVAFLKCLSSTIDTLGFDEAKRQCVMGNLINADATSAKMAQKWHETLEWLKSHEKEVIEFVKENFISFDEQCGIWADKLAVKTDTMPKFRGYLREIFGNFIGGFLERIFC